MTTDPVFAAFTKLDATNLLAHYGLTLELPSGADTLGLRLSGDSTPRVALGTVANNGALAFTNGAGTGIGVFVATSGLVTLTQSNLVVPALSVSGLTGSTTAANPSRYCGCTTSGAAPTDGTFAVGDWVIGIVVASGQATVWTCLVAGTPGTWVQAGVELLPVTAITASTHTAAVNTIVPLNTTSNAITVTLPTAPADGSTIVLKAITISGQNLVTYNTGGSDVLNKASGPTAGVMTFTGQEVTLQYQTSSAIWHILTPDPATGAFAVSDGTASHGKALIATNILGQAVSLFGDTGDTQPKAQLAATGLVTGPGGVTATDFKILRTGAAAGAVTGVLTMTSPVLTTGVSGTAVDTDSTFATGAATTVTASSAVKTALALKATLASPTFTGTLTAPTLTATGQINTAVGTTAIAPIVFASGGTNLTSAVAGGQEYDGTQFYSTIDTTSGRGIVPVEQYFRLTSDGGTISTIANYFGSTSNIALVANAYYEIEIYCWFLNSTTGTLVWTFTNSAAPTSQNIHYRYSPVTGVNTGAGAATYLEGDIVKDATAAKALTVSGSLTDAVDHYAHFMIWLKNGTGTSLKIQATKAVGGTITPRLGSYWRARRLPANSTGTFVA